MSGAVVQDFYALLRLQRTATQTEIKSAYRRVARTLHPDVNGGCKVRFPPLITRQSCRLPG